MDAEYWLLMVGFTVSCVMFGGFAGWGLGFRFGDKEALEKVRRALGASRVSYTMEECVPGHIVRGRGLFIMFQDKTTSGCIFMFRDPPPNSLEQLIKARDESRKPLIEPNMKVTWAKGSE